MDNDGICLFCQECGATRSIYILEKGQLMPNFLDVYRTYRVAQLDSIPHKDEPFMGAEIFRGICPFCQEEVVISYQRYSGFNNLDDLSTSDILVQVAGENCFHFSSFQYKNQKPISVALFKSNSGGTYVYRPMEKVDYMLYLAAVAKKVG